MKLNVSRASDPERYPLARWQAYIHGEWVFVDAVRRHISTSDPGTFRVEVAMVPAPKAHPEQEIRERDRQEQEETDMTDREAEAQ